MVADDGHSLGEILVLSDQGAGIKLGLHIGHVSLHLDRAPVSGLQLLGIVGIQRERLGIVRDEQVGVVQVNNVNIEVIRWAVGNIGFHARPGTERTLVV